MVRRTQRFWAFGNVLRSAGRAGFFGLLCLALTGCGGPPTPPPPPHLTQSDRLSVYGDDLIIQGRKLRDQGSASGDDAMKSRGEAMIAQGRLYIERANTMTDQPEPRGPAPH